MWLLLRLRSESWARWIPTRQLLSDRLELFWTEVQIVVGVQRREEKQPLASQGLQGQLLVWGEETSEISSQPLAEIRSGPSRLQS